MRRTLLVVAALVVVIGVGACGGDATTKDAGPRPSTTSTPTRSPRSVGITATEYAFDAPPSIEGGLVEVAFSNGGAEPHFLAFARAGAGKTFADVKAALTTPPTGAPPTGPPPFEPFGGVPTTDPGTAGSIVVNLPEGTYALFCTIPAADGAPHAVKGMIRELVVAPGPEGELPTAVRTVTATDFALATTGALGTGPQVVELRNEGRQLHEINLIELASGATIEQAVAWIGKPVGRPPYKSLSGVAIKAGSEATAKLDLEPGRTYALVCVIPDALGDRAPHATKGMFTPSFRVPA
jgi:uncharacterized cupredoxin-like copper-binding protein